MNPLMQRFGQQYKVFYIIVFVVEINVVYIKFRRYLYTKVFFVILPVIHFKKNARGFQMVVAETKLLAPGHYLSLITFRYKRC